MSDIFAIVIEPSSELQREQVQAAIKSNAENWWHGMADLWFVKGKDAVAWRDLLAPMFPNVNGKVFVFRVGTQGTGISWAYRATFSDSATEWVKNNLNHKAN